MDVIEITNKNILVTFTISRARCRKDRAEKPTACKLSKTCNLTLSCSSTRDNKRLPVRTMLSFLVRFMVSFLCSPLGVAKEVVDVVVDVLVESNFKGGSSSFVTSSRPDPPGPGKSTNGLSIEVVDTFISVTMCDMFPLCVRLYFSDIC